MKRILLTLLFSGLCTLATMAQAPLGMNYQAVIRNSTGEVVANQQIGLQLSVLQGSSSGTSVYSETFTPTTNEFGLVNVILGQGKSKSGDYSAINWSTANYYLKVGLDLNGGSSYQTMGVTQLLSVPYANFAFSSKTIEGDGGNATISGTLQVVSDGTNSEEVPIFQVKNSKGETVFAVYENGVEILIDETSGAKTKGAFAISGKTTTKGTQEILTVTPELTQIYVDEPTTKTKGGFAISGRTTTKEGEADILTVTPSLTQVFVEETTTKTKGGFAISGRTTTKSTGTYDVFTVVPERTDVYVKPSPSKNALPIGFSVSGLDFNYEPTELFSISEQGTFVATNLAVAPKMGTYIVKSITQTTAIAGGKLLDNGGTSIIATGVVYSQKGLRVPTLDNVANLTKAEGGIVLAGTSTDFNNLTLSMLKPGTTYVVRAFATNSDMLTGYGDAKEFTTDAPTKFTVSVIDNDTENPILNSTVSLWPSFGGDPILSGPSGTHNFNIGNGTYNYIIEAPGYYDLEISNYLVNEDKTQVERLDATSLPKVSIVVQNQYGEPIRYTEVMVGEDVSYTNINGVAVFYLEPGTRPYSVNVPEVGYETYEGGELVVTTELTQVYNVILTELPKIVFNIKDSQGKPVLQGDVILSRIGHEDIWGYIDYDTPGKATLYEVPAGQWEYSIYCEGFKETTGKIDVIEGQNLFVNVTLEPPKKFTVKVVVIDNFWITPIANAEVNLNSEETSTYLDQTTDQSGITTFYNVPEGEYNITVYESGHDTYDEMITIDENNPDFNGFEIVINVSLSGV
ncbi:hypothetical protein [Perlabentimonas gracilis]|uniref:hypothetical protein n=1 Tax=Perlabentimonas gracilis TaxID=2715279 RepID=UPI001409B3A4|nr:hypothetical protein [Perlabentimonas gracilis]NHB68449.1 hypothetical protein [Perlabentimonas gracilis]